MKILLMGPQGSGKGTIGEMLSAKLGVPFVSGGDLLRRVPHTHPNYNEMHEYMSRGVLVPSELAASLWIERLKRDDCKNGFIMDGWARSLENLKYFNPELDKVIVLNISKETSIKRISGRRICDTDGETYNVYTLPKEELAECEGHLVQREDDTEEAVKRRLEIYYTQTLKVIEYYRSKGLVVEVNAEGLPDKVFSAVLSALNIE